MNEPCFDPAPHWIQIPVIMFLLIAVGFCGGFVVGGMWVEWCDTKFVKWLLRKFGGPQ
jgi:ABC-type polysaccharide/polyol phosphate export permease